MMVSQDDPTTPRPGRADPAFAHWDKLTYGIERGECILFLGPELPAEGPETSADAIAQNAYVMVRPINSRGSVAGYVDPFK